jgi:hypothetical protein
MAVPFPVAVFAEPVRGRVRAGSRYMAGVRLRARAKPGPEAGPRAWQDAGQAEPSGLG